MSNIEISREIMAKTMFGEARGEYKKYGLNSIIAVGNVIMNRATKSGKTIEEVCFKPWQFSCWNLADPNRKIIENIRKNDDIYRLCLDTATDVINHKIDDVTNGADHYYSTKLLKPPPWSASGNITARIGTHIFLKL